MQCPDCGQAYPGDATQCACGFDFVGWKPSPTPRRVGWNSPGAGWCAALAIGCCCAAGLLYREHWPYVSPGLAAAGMVLAVIGGALAGRRSRVLTPAELVPMVRGAATCVSAGLAILCLVLAGFAFGEFSLGGTVALGVASLVLGAVAAVLAGHRAPGLDDVVMPLVLLGVSTLLLWLGIWLIKGLVAG